MSSFFAFHTVVVNYFPVSAQYPLLLLLDHQKGYRFSLVVVGDRKFTLGVLLGPKICQNSSSGPRRFAQFSDIRAYAICFQPLQNKRPRTPYFEKRKKSSGIFLPLSKTTTSSSESTKCAMRYLFTTTTTLLTHSLRFLTFLTAKLYTKLAPRKRTTFLLVLFAQPPAFFHGFGLPTQKIMIFLRRMGRFFHQTIFHKIRLSFKTPEPLFRAIPPPTRSNHSPEGRAVETKGKIYEKMRFFGPATTEN